MKGTAGFKGIWTIKWKLSNLKGTGQKTHQKEQLGTSELGAPAQERHGSVGASPQEAPR